MTKRITISLIFCFYAFIAISQVRFYTRTDARKIIQGSYLEVEFVLENANGTSFNPPKFDGFEVISGPNISSSTRIVNGSRSTSRGFTYMLAGDNVGRYTIGPATIKANNNTLKTQPVIIEVVKGSNQGVDNNKKSMVVVEVNDSTAFIGQQILLDYKLYTTEEVVNYNIDRQPEFDGFYVQEVATLRSRSQREIIEGVEYQTQILKRYALFPQQTGSYTIESSGVTLGISTGRKSNNFFFNQQTRPFRTKTNTLTILVDNVPRSAPSDFSGAIGTYRMSSKLEKRIVTSDEAIRITMDVSGDGDNRMVLAPQWEIPEGMELYDPNILDEQTYAQQTGFTHKKTFEYLLVAEKAGTYSISPSFSYFDVDKNEFVQLKRNNFQVRVAQGSSKNQNLDIIDDSEQLFPNAITTKLRKQDGEFYGSFIHKSLFTVLLIALMGLFVQKRRLEKLGQLDPKYFLQLHAHEKSMGELDIAKGLIAKKKGKEYFEKISTTLKYYLEEKFEIPAIHLKKEKLLEEVMLLDPDSTVIENLKFILDKSEQALYAPITITDMESTHKRVIETINSLEENSLEG